MASRITGIRCALIKNNVYDQQKSAAVCSECPKMALNVNFSSANYFSSGGSFVLSLNRFF